LPSLPSVTICFAETMFAGGVRTEQRQYQRGFP
jgi:hypothetical protein